MHASGVQIVQDTTDITGSTLYVATFINNRFQVDTPLQIENGVFKSTDGGASWSNVSNGLPKINGNPAAATDNILSLAFDPTDPNGQTLYASANDIVNSAFDSVYKTIDGGASWTFTGAGLQDRDVRDLIVDPATGDVYAAASDTLLNGDGGVFVSKDGGASWSSISAGFPAGASALKLALDTAGPNLVIHAGTSKGVQTFEVLPDLDLDGAPDSVEDNAPNAGDGNNDGIPDSTQADVASPTVNAATRVGTSYITASLNGISGNCNVLQNSFGLDLLTSVPIEASLEAPFNGLKLRIPDCEEVEVTLIYHDADFSDPSFTMRAYGLTFPDEQRAMWQTLPATVDGIEWTFTLTDGEVGDATPDDGIIVFQGAAKRLVEAFFRDSMEAE